MIHTGIQMTPNNHILVERRGRGHEGRTCNEEEEEEEEEKHPPQMRAYLYARG